MKERLLEKIESAVASLVAEAGPAPSFTLEVPRQAEHGDFACNAALVLAKRLKAKPREIAQRLIDALGSGDGLIERTEIAGPGFVNIWLAQERWHDLLARILDAGERFGHASPDASQAVQVEFVSANPTGPLTLGHGRQGVLGDCIARLLEAAGHRVTREYYFNNGGRQMRVLGQSVKARYLEQLGRAAAPPPECLAAPDSDWPESIDGLPVVFPADGYQGEYIAEIAADLARLHGDKLCNEPAEEIFRATAEERIFGEIQETLRKLDIAFDVYTNEKSFYDDGKIDETVAALREKGLVYEKDDATWLKATELGLDRDRVIVKRTGEPTYLLPDIAYHRDKVQRGFDCIIDVQGADHIEQFPFVREAAAALGADPQCIELVMHQFVTLTRGGSQVKQSTRRATYVTVDELIADVGPDVFRFFMVQRRAEGHLDFDLDLARETDWKKNPAYYVQYAHARTCGVERKAREQGAEIPAPDAIDASSLVLPEEIALLKKLGEFPDAVAGAANAREPHHIAYFLREVAGLWNPYLQDGVRHRILSDDAALTSARLAMAGAVRTVLANGLALLGITAPERM